MDIVRLDNSLLSIERLVSYLQYVNNDFKISLDKKTTLVSFVEKLLRNGVVYMAIDENGTDSAMIGFYCNDEVDKVAHWSILSTKLQARGKGYATKLILKMIEECRVVGMQYIVCDSVNPIAVSLYKSMGFIIYDQKLDGDNLISYLRLSL